jgi:hypothetical protein
VADPRLTLTPELAATIRGARLVGTPLRACARAAGVPWDTLIGWLRVGRAYNEAAPEKRNPRHAAQAAFAADLDKAGAQCESALHARVMSATVKDGRLALDVLRWNEERATRKLKRDLVAAQVEVERARAAGDYVERHEVTEVAVVDEIRRRIARLSDAAGAGVGAVVADASSGDGAAHGVAVLGAPGSTRAAR